MIIIAKTIRGINVKIGSDTSGLSAALKDVNKKSRDIRSELRKVERLLKFNPDDTELLAQKQQLLSDRVENTSEKLRRLKKVQDQVNEQFKKGEIGEQQYRAFQREIKKTESKLETFEAQLSETTSSSGKLARKLQAAGNKLKGIGEKMKGVGESISMKVTAPLTGAFVALTEGTRNFRKEISVLDNNIKSAGASSENINKAMAKTKAITGETKDSVEGLSNLLATDFRGDKFQQVLDNLIGASIKFKETIKFEEVANSFQETIASGEAVGQFGELLERTGVNLDEFEAGLREAKKRGKEQNYILQTLADTGLSQIYEQYKKNNSELVNNAEANYMFQKALGKLGSTLDPIMTKLIKFATKVVDKFNEFSPAAKKLTITIAGVAAVIGPVITTMGVLAASLSALLSPVGAVVAAISALSVVGIEVYRNWQEVKNSLSAIWDFLKTEAQIFATQIQLAFAGVQFGISKMINVIVDKASILSKLPGKWGDKFDKFSSSVSKSTEKTKDKLDNLTGRLSSLNDEAGENLNNMGVSFSNLGSNIKEDVKGIVSVVTGLGESYDTAGEKAEEAAEKAKEAVKKYKDQTKPTKEEIKKREKFEQKWNDKLFNLTASRIEKLEKEKQEAIKNAKEKGAKTTAIEEYYAEKKNQIREGFEESWKDKLFQITATREEKLEKEKQRALERAEELGASKLAIKKYYVQKEKELLSNQLARYQKQSSAISTAIKAMKDNIIEYTKRLYNNTAQASLAMSKSMTSFFDSFTNGSKTFKEAVKEMALSFVTMAEQQVIAAEAMGVAQSWAQAPSTLGASLAYIGEIVSKSAAAIATFESVKAVIREFADGGLVTGPTLGMIGEAGDDEAVLPLNQKTMSTLGASIAANMPQQQQTVQPVSQRPIELHVGTLVADKMGLKKLERKLRSIRISENKRLGVNNA
ncbi:hypothetical protein [Sporohalobacter salinus]|uniref:hypothetical protein n=1 Tax=Sporohalobacter salinus TaxID=1494606 RepID=UPI001961BE17|nr:hypothetical protein [Sporohalobacter salinus]MBM7624785.1 phage-related minor tail protein [Sporohalobacter salinus]